MPSETGNELVEYAQSQVGDALRTVAVLYEDDSEVIYLRDDLAHEYSREQYRHISASFRIDLNEELHQSNTSLVDEKIAIIHYHDSAYVFQFPHDGCHSILLSIEPRVGERLQNFIEGCDRRI